MKKLIICLSMLVLCVFACKKRENGTMEAGYSSHLTQVIQYLRDSIPKTAFDSLDMKGAIASTTDSGRTYFVRVPPQGWTVAEKFMLIRTDPSFKPTGGARIEIRTDSTPSDVLPRALSFFGTIKKAYLNGAPQFLSPVIGGYIQLFHPKRSVIPAIFPEDQPIELPEIVIIGDPDDGYDASWDLILAEGSGDAGGFSGYSPSSGGGGSAGGGSSSASAFATAFLSELQASKPGINLAAFFNCFTIVPDNDATTYTATLMVKVPDPGNPSIMWDPTQVDGVGHVFVGLTKSNGSNSISQYIGFYGQGGADNITLTALGFSVPSKMVDNGGHPYNATLSVSLTGAQFSDFLVTLQDYSAVKYNLSSYNCSDYAMDAFNTFLPNQLDPPSTAFPGQVPGTTPNGLFELLESMPSNGPDGQVSISNAPLTAGPSHGECN